MKNENDMVEKKIYLSIKHNVPWLYDAYNYDIRSEISGESGVA